MVFPIDANRMEMSDRSQRIIHGLNVDLVVISVFIIIVSFYVPFSFNFQQH